MISNGEDWHYLAVKSLSRLLRGITSNHDGDYYCLNCFQSIGLTISLMLIRKCVKTMTIVTLRCPLMIII